MATTIRAMLNRDRASKSGNYPLVIRVIHNRRKKLIYSPYRLKPEEFDDIQERVLLSDDSAHSKSRIDEMNRFIRSKKQEIERAIERLEREKKREGFTAEDLIMRMHRHNQDRYLFYYLDREIAAKEKSNRQGTAEIYVSTRNSLHRFVGSRIITFGDITYRFISDYIDHLRERKVCDNTIHMYLRNLRSIYNKARKEGLVPSKIYPFLDVRMSGTKTTKRALCKDMLRNIAKLDLSHDWILDGVRDIFLFSFYTRGMSLVDILHLKQDNIQDGVIHYIRNKTNQHFHVAVTPQVQLLIDKYHSPHSEYVWPYLDNSKQESIYRQYRRAISVINLHLKSIGKMAGIEKPLTSYVARHSWATIAKTEGVPIATISEGLGHTTEKTTQIYLRTFDHSVIDEVNARIIAL